MADGAIATPMRVERRGRWFFFGASLVMLAVIVAGFSPTFYLRGWVFAPVPPPFPLHPYMILHGCAMTAWCLFYVGQSWLAASGRTTLHRRTGWLGCGLLAAALLTAFYTTLNIVRTRVEAGFPVEAGLESPMKIVMFANFSVLPVFAGLFTAAVLLRKRREWHGRLMYWTFVLTVGPALGGGGTRLLEPLIMHWIPVPAVLPSLVVALAALIVHDLRARGRLHPATFVGALVNFVAPFPGLILAFSPAGEQVFRSLA